MLSQLIEMFSYDFICRGLLAGVFLAIIAAVVGLILVLRGKSMIGDGLSHVSFGAVALAMLIGASPTWFAIVVSIIVAAILVRTNKKGSSRSDSSIAVISIAALSLGMMFLSLQKGSTIDPNSYLFGSIITVTNLDVIISIISSVLSVAVFLVFYKQIFAITFDEEFARAIGIKVSLYDLILAVICAVVISLGMKICGALLIGALLVFPALSAIKLTKSFKASVVVSVILGVIGFVFGFVASYALAMPVGPVIATAELIVCGLSYLVSKVK